MKRLSRKLFSPIVTFIGIQVAWVVLVGVWIYWFMSQHEELRGLAQKYGPEIVLGREDWFILAEGLVLFFAILAGIYVIFLYWRRQAALNREQKNFFSQMTHELKSPLASLQLHLETLRLRRIPVERMDPFIQTMLADTERLDSLINNLLTAHRLESQHATLATNRTNLSELVRQSLERFRELLPADARMDTHIAPNLYAEVEAESIRMVLRNLTENAILYADKPLVIDVRLYRQEDRIQLDFADNGRGIEHQDLRKVFRMFYRVRRQDETKPGSGLGLFIVRNIIRRHRGKVRLVSPGTGLGATFHISLPLHGDTPP
jgi:signal transduction histidine kinase